MSKKTKKTAREAIAALGQERDEALTGFIEAVRLANQLSLDLRGCMEALELERERVAKDIERRLLRGRT